MALNTNRTTAILNRLVHLISSALLMRCSSTSSPGLTNRDHTECRSAGKSIDPDGVKEKRGSYASPSVQIGSSGRTRTYNHPVNSRTLCQLSYRGTHACGIILPHGQLSNQCFAPDRKGGYNVEEGNEPSNMLTLDQQEAYRRRYSAEHPGWRPSSHVYQDLVIGRLSPGADVLDLGCGRGGVMERLHARAGHVVGLDQDLTSLREHRAPAFALMNGTAEAIPFADHAFDLVCCSWLLEHLANPARCLVEIARVLRPGGRFIFLTPNALHPLLAANRLIGWTRGQLTQIVYRRAEVDIFPTFYWANTPDTIERLARTTGFERASLRLVGDPTYLAFSEPMYRWAALLERVMPCALRIHLVGEFVVS